MQYESLQEALDSLRKLEKTQMVYQHIMGVMELDGAASAPSGSWEGRGTALGILSEKMYELIADPENGALLSYLQEHREQLSSQEAREVEVVFKNYNQLHRIPADEYVAYTVLLNDAQAVWEKAKKADDFSLFQPSLEQIIAYNRKFAGYYNPDMEPYDALLNEYEEGMTTAVLDAFFARLRSTIVPLLEKIREKQQPEPSFVNDCYPVQLQRDFSDQLMEFMGLDRRYCAISETEHPFTTNFNNHDVRITTHYYEKNMLPSMFSVIHEGGHALYELGSDDKYNYTALYGGISMGIHESQSRFYENLIGRSEAFARFIFPKIREIFPKQMENADEEQFYRAINRAEAGLIRIEADELSYCLHIMVRYEIEKQLISGQLEVKDVPALWNRMYKEYLGVDVPSDAMGCLQDIHWACGNIGYFPSYALGSAYGAQMLKVMEKELGDIWQDVEQGDLTRITGWLREHIHQYASFKKPGQLFEDACGTFDPTYYTDYLTEKFTKLYNL